MAQRIRFFSTWTCSSVWRVLNAAVSVVLSLVCFVTGQTRRSDAPTSGGVASLLKTAVDDIIAPVYGIEPLYGPIVEYGMPYADYAFKGTVASAVDSSPVGGAKVYLYKETADTAVDSAVTDENGAYEVGVSGVLPQAEWRIAVIDVDGAANGDFDPQDTTVNIPLDSLKGGSACYAGSAAVNADILLKPHAPMAVAGAAGRTKATNTRSVQLARRGETIRVGTTGLAEGADVAGIIVDASGRVVWRFSGTANTEYAFSSRGLAAGVYSAIVLCGKTRLVSRMELR